MEARANERGLGNAQSNPVKDCPDEALLRMGQAAEEEKSKLQEMNSSRNKLTILSVITPRAGGRSNEDAATRTEVACCAGLDDR